MIGGTGMSSLWAEIGQGGGWLNIAKRDVPENGCSNWKRTSADVS